MLAVDWSDHKIDAWATYFYDKLPVTSAIERPVFAGHERDGITTSSKILGIFVRLAQRDGKMRYLSDIPKYGEIVCLNWNGSAHMRSKVKSEGGGISEQADADQ